MRDRLLLCRDLLAPSGSIFVQISDDNMHYVRELMDEVFGNNNFCCLIAFNKTTGSSAKLLSTTIDYLVWYAKDKDRVKFHNIYNEGKVNHDDFDYCEFDDGTICHSDEIQPDEIKKYRLFKLDDSSSQGEPSGGVKPYNFQGVDYYPTPGRHFSHDTAGMDRLVSLGYVMAKGKRLFFKNYLDTTKLPRLNDIWLDTQLGGFKRKLEKLYAVQTSEKVLQRCLLMTCDPGDLVLDPTCGSGTTAYVAEQWGRRWITMDVSRVPLALSRQRLLTATFPYYQLKDETRGPVGGFVYLRKQNRKGEEVGGIVPHVTLKSIAKNEPPEEEVLVDRPEVVKNITRVTGPFCVEATIPAPMDWEEGAGEGESQEEHGSFTDRMLEVLRKSPVLHVGGGKTVTLKNIRLPAKTLSLSVEAIVAGPSTANGQQDEPDMVTTLTSPLLSGSKEAAVALVFGPENGAVSEKLVNEAAREAHNKSYRHLYVIGFAIQPNARQLVDHCEAVVGIAATYVQATPDLMMGDLLKNMRSSQIFSVCGLPEVKLRRVHPEKAGEPVRYQAELLGLDVFDPATMETMHRQGDDVPAWLLDTDYNGLCFHVGQAFFPRTSAWDSLKKALKGTYEESVWDHLAGKLSAPFEAGEHGQVAVKVIDDRGNELLVVKNLAEAEG